MLQVVNRRFNDMMTLVCLRLLKSAAVGDNSNENHFDLVFKVGSYPFTANCNLNANKLFCQYFCQLCSVRDKQHPNENILRMLHISFSARHQTNYFMFMGYGINKGPKIKVPPSYDT